jgi:hypothetical protein
LKGRIQTARSTSWTPVSLPATTIPGSAESYQRQARMAAPREPALVTSAIQRDRSSMSRLEKPVKNRRPSRTTISAAPMVGRKVAQLRTCPV